ncbi:MAG: ATP-binding cassette subfamily F protein 3 [Sphingobacteriales bacterium]
MLAVNQLEVAFGGRTLFRDANFSVSKEDRVGLAGKNGSGKSTLLQIIAGLQPKQKGTITIPSDYTMGYLRQELGGQSELSVIDEAKKAFEHVQQMEQEIQKLEEYIATEQNTHTDEYMDKLSRFSELHEKFAMLGGNEMEMLSSRVLKGLGFNEEDLNRPLAEFSGGWKMRVELAKLLLQQPDVLLLDEPTNHLDIESIQWLEGYLSTYSGAIMLVSHDKLFLDTITNRTLEISNGKIEDYRVNYSKYLVLRQERRDNLVSAAKNQEKEIEQLEKNINRFRAKASKASFAQSLMKKLDKIDRIEVDNEDIHAFNFKFNVGRPSGKVVVNGEGITKSFDDNQVIKPLDFYVNRGEKIAFVGKNGMGKTTLASMIGGKLEPTSGGIEIGHFVSTGFFGQEQAKLLDPKKTVLEVLDDEARGEIRTKLRDILGSFLFSGEDAEKKVNVLSGGEKSRLALAKLLLEPHNFLILDEPTNHLDLASKAILKDALLNYEGTMVIVSHDRDFLQGLTDKVFEFTPTGVKEYLGDIDFFLDRKKVENFRELERTKVNKAAPTQSAPAQKKVKKEKPKLSYQEQKLRQSELSKVERTISNAEKDVEKFTLEIGELETKMMDSNAVKNDPDLFGRHSNLKVKLEKAEAAWEVGVEKLEEMKKED